MTRHVKVGQRVTDAIHAGRITPPMIVHHRGDRIPVFHEKDLSTANGGPVGPDGPGVLVLAMS